MRCPDRTCHDLVVSGKPGANPHGSAGSKTRTCQSGYNHCITETGSEIDDCDFGRTHHPVEHFVWQHGSSVVQSGRCGMQYTDHDAAQKMPDIRTGWNQRCWCGIP